MSSPSDGSRLDTRFGPYELQSLIGVGGMGEVYRAYDTIRDRTVAIKLLRRELAADPAFQERFRRECRRTARLQDPHVVPVHDFGQIDGVLFIDMRLIDGRSLREALSERGAFEPAQAALIVAQVASALDAAHADRLVHRDVKPENVLLTADNFAYLVDFGIAQAGSSAYLAPEGFGGARVGPQADVYSLTCLLYECLTGQPPFERAEIRQLMSAHVFSPPPRPSIMRRGIARNFDDVVAVGMAKQAGARYSSAGELARAATAAAWGDHAPSTRPFSSSYPMSFAVPDDTDVYVPADRPGLGRAPVVVGAVAVGILAVAGVLAGVVALGGNHGSAPPATPAAAPSAAPSAPTTTTTMPVLSRPVQGADGLGFIGHSARCDPGNPPASVVRTAKSLAVVCQTPSGSFYYRGERIRDGANIELPNAVRVADGFDVANPADGTRYEVRPQRLKILSNRHVDSSERVLQYATAS